MATNQPTPPSSINAAAEEALVVDDREEAADMQPDSVLDSDDNDSAFGDGDSVASSYTTSLTSSVRDYTYENGRRYHAFRAGQYVIPNDEKEQDRLDFMHHIFYMTLGGKLQLAPIGDSPQRVLDVGTGTGIWAIDFADAYPSAEVIGLDLSPIQPQWLPPNLTFHIDDHLRPGGWIELTDFDAWASTDDNSLPESSSYHVFQVALAEAAERFGRIMNVGPLHRRHLEAAGFVDIVQDKRKVPLSPWPRDPRQKELGRYMQIQMLDAVESYGLAPLTRILGWDNTRVQVLLAGVRQDLRTRDYHMYSNCITVYGRKPL
ncbi:S-adenosyl-L-methionine-dependent methyltransferase [Bisporella sp. PMI_857]|nr:S-adenosyl-L-methionine-dependent methyltransferase [Bisporella sp. PMI_857]